MSLDLTACSGTLLASTGLSMTPLKMRSGLDFFHAVMVQPRDLRIWWWKKSVSDDVENPLLSLGHNFLCRQRHTHTHTSSWLLHFIHTQMHTSHTHTTNTHMNTHNKHKHTWRVRKGLFPLTFRTRFKPCTHTHTHTHTHSLQWSKRIHRRKQAKKHDCGSVARRKGDARADERTQTRRCPLSSLSSLSLFSHLDRRRRLREPLVAEHALVDVARVDDKGWRALALLLRLQRLRLRLRQRRDLWRELQMHERSHVFASSWFEGTLRVHDLCLFTRKCVSCGNLRRTCVRMICKTPTKRTWGGAWAWGSQKWWRGCSLLFHPSFYEPVERFWCVTNTQKHTFSLNASKRTENVEKTAGKLWQWGQMYLKTAL